MLRVLLVLLAVAFLVLTAAAMTAALRALSPDAAAQPTATPAVTVERSSEFQERADRGRIRPLQPPAAPDARSPVAARPAPQRATRPPARPIQAAPAFEDRWARLRQCESGGNYAINTGNGFYGAYQFTLGTWRSVGGTGLPSAAPPAEQDARAQLLYHRRGTSPWPVCGRYL